MYSKFSFIAVNVITGILCIAFNIPAQEKHELVFAKDSSGICGYKDTPIQPWSGYHVHDPDRPAPPRIIPGKSSSPEEAGTAPSDAMVLFNGKDLSLWQSSEWFVKDGYMEATKGALTTKESFGDFQLHIEWQAPNPPRGEMFNRGNSGVMIMGMFEIQIFDSYTEKLYPDGQAAAVYGETPPLVNACLEPGKWQTYDIIFSAPVFKFGKLIERARVTVLHNGVLVHNNTEIMGKSGHRILGYYQEPVSKGPIVLSAHNNPVRFRNIWIRPL